MASLITDLGDVRLIVGDPHPQPTTELFRQSVLLSPDVRAALRSSRSRLLHVSGPDAEAPLDGVLPGGEAVFYDYTRNRVVRARGPLSGAGRLQVVREIGQPRPSPEEFEEAVALVAASPVWGPLLQAGHVRPYPTMPPNLEPEGDEEVERTLFVGLYSRERKFNRMVAVNMIRRTVSREEFVPRTARANASLCGPDIAPCRRPARGTAGAATVVWPRPPASEIWRFRVSRPAASSGTNGSGVEISNVYFRKRLVLKHAHVPVLNVQYVDDLCGPYRDWLYEETCFDAVGTDARGTRGIRVCTQPPQMIWEKQEDGGNFVGVALWGAEDGSLRVLSQCSAGWYRYAPEWRFYPDGRIEPRFRFGAVADSCTCNAHIHHAYWRFDWNVITAANVVEELQDGVWTPLTRETTRVRTPEQDVRWRVLNQTRKVGYEIITGEEDGFGDAFSGPDAYLMLRRPGEVDDKHRLTGQARADLLKYVRNDNVARKDLVTWYVAHFSHTQPEAAILHDNHNHAYGPTLRPFNWPGT